MSYIYDDNLELFTNRYLSTNDVLLVPKTGMLDTRKAAQVAGYTFLYSSPMDTVTDDALISEMLSSNQASLSCRFFPKEKKLDTLHKFHADENFWYSVGSSKEEFQQLKNIAIRNNYKLNIAVDVAHGDTTKLYKIYSLYSSQSWCRKLMSGTIATPASARKVYTHGCTHIRVGIGPGSACSTRIVTGCGVPNLSAIFNVYSEFLDEPERPTIIADGGIKTSGDICKYLSAGADAVMMGSVLSSLKESAGWRVSFLSLFIYILTFGIFKSYKLYYKYYRGQASAEFQLDRKGSVSGTPEGVQGPIQYQTTTFDKFFHGIVGGIASSLSYLGLKNVANMSPKTVSFIKITQNGYKESTPHILD